MSILTKKLIFGLVAALIMADAVAPAAAQPGPPPPPPPGWGGPGPGPGWGPPPPPRWRRHCWYEERRVRVMTDRGPRWRTRTVRICR
ncbi:MAG: hypothetical protein LWW93_03540 [Hyphomicrobiales bacterium]|nr:hypothetical protein [Hyphomicrobiales bacterium]